MKVMNMSSLKVRKRDGDLDDWSFDKLVTSMAKAGMNMEEAENLSKQVETWVMVQSQKGEITSSDIRDKVISSMAKIDPAAADSYRVYKKE